MKIKIKSRYELDNIPCVYTFDEYGDYCGAYYLHKREHQDEDCDCDCSVWSLSSVSRYIIGKTLTVSRSRLNRSDNQLEWYNAYYCVWIPSWAFNKVESKRRN